MTLEQARALVVALHARLGNPSSDGLNAAGHGGVMLATEVVTFQFVAARQLLIARAHVLELEKPMKPEVLERVQAQLAARPEAGGGGALTYDADVRLLALTREYAQPVPAETLLADVKRLAVATLTFSELLYR